MELRHFEHWAGVFVFLLAELTIPTPGCKDVVYINAGVIGILSYYVAYQLMNIFEITHGV